MGHSVFPLINQRDIMLLEDNLFVYSSHDLVLCDESGKVVWICLQQLYKLKGSMRGGSYFCIFMFPISLFVAPVFSFICSVSYLRLLNN